MTLSRRRLLAVAATTGAVGAVAPRATAQATTTTDWTATYDGDGGASVSALLADGDGYLAAGTTFRGAEDDRVWLLPVGGDGTAGDVTTLDGFAGSYVVDAAGPGERRVVAGTASGVGDPARPWLVAREGGSRAWTYEPSFEDRADYRAAAAVALDGEVALAADRSTATGGDGPEYGSVTLVGPDGERRSRARVGGGEGGVDAPLSLEDATATGDGGVVLGGTVGGIGERAAWFGAVDPGGGLRWSRRVGAVEGTSADAVTACERVGDGYLVGVRTTPSPTSADPYVLRVGPEGETRWRYDATGEGGPRAFAVTGAGVVTGGAAPLQDVRPQFWLAWVGEDGTERWAETFGEEGGVTAMLADGAGVVVGGDRGNAADVRRLTIEGAPDDGGGDGGDGGDGGNENGDGGGLPLPGFGVGAAVAGGALGVAEYVRRRRD